MPRNYEPEFKKKIVRLHIEQGRTYKSITNASLKPNPHQMLQMS